MASLHMTNATARFSCLQGDCPDTCCNGFRVGLSEEEFLRLDRTLESNPHTANRQALVRLVRKHHLQSGAPGADATFAQVDGNCVLLDTDGLCAIHRTFGERELPTVCSLYPRTVADVDGQLEVFLTLACPEAARLVLTDGDAFDIAPDNVADASLEEHRRSPHRNLWEQANTPYRPHHLEIQQRTLALEAAAGSLREVMFFLAVFADAISEASMVSDAELAATLEDFSSPRVVDTLRENLKGLSSLFEEDADFLAVELASDLLATRLGQGPHERFARVVREILFASPPTKDDVKSWFSERSENSRSTQDLVIQRMRSQEACETVFPGRVEDLMRAMVRHELRTEWWIRGTSPRHQVSVLMIRLVLVSLLVSFDDRIQGGPGDESARAELDAAVVDAVQLVAKNVTHVPTFARLLELALEERGRIELTGVLVLLPRPRV